VPGLSSSYYYLNEILRVSKKNYCPLVRAPVKPNTLNMHKSASAERHCGSEKFAT